MHVRAAGRGPARGRESVKRGGEGGSAAALHSPAGPPRAAMALAAAPPPGRRGPGGAGLQFALSGAAVSVANTCTIPLGQ